MHSFALFMGAFSGLGFEVRNGYQSAPALDVFELQDIAQAVDDDPVNAGGNVQVACWRGEQRAFMRRTAGLSSNGMAHPPGRPERHRRPGTG